MRIFVWLRFAFAGDTWSRTSPVIDIIPDIVTAYTYLQERSAMEFYFYIVYSNDKRYP